MKKIFTILAMLFVMLFASCSDENGNGSGSEKNTTLRIKNESFTEITDVIW